MMFFYHNHTNKGIEIFSPHDIYSLIEIARFQNTGNSSNAFMEVISYWRYTLCNEMGR